MAKRGRLEIIRDILKIVQDHRNSIRPTPLLRFSNLSTVRFNEYIDELYKKEFIQDVLDKKEKKLISLTEKGFRFLEKYETIIGFVDDFGL